VRLHWNPVTRVEEIKVHQILYLAFSFDPREGTITFYKHDKQQLDDLKQRKADFINMLQDQYHNNKFEEPELRKAVLKRFQTVYEPQLANLTSDIENWISSHTDTYKLDTPGQVTLNHVNIGIEFESDDEFKIDRQPFEDDNGITVFSFTGYHTLRQNEQGDFVPYFPVMGSRQNPIVVDDSENDMDIQGFEQL